MIFGFLGADEVEVEEDLGPIEDEQVAAVKLEFDIEVNQETSGDQGDSSSADGEDDDDEEEVAEEKAPDPPKRRRRENTMIGFIRKGKYSI